MEIKHKVAVITGGGSGIGAALARVLANSGAKVVVSDLDLVKAESVASEFGGVAIQTDVAKEDHIIRLIDEATNHAGPIDIFCSVAGLAFGEPSHSGSASNEAWQTCWDVHVMSHVYAARTLLPSMIERKQGYFVNVASAAGLLSQIGDAAYSTTKHAAVGFAESLAITHGVDGIGVSVICPQYVATPMLGLDEPNEVQRGSGIISADEVAECIRDGIENERFLILPHEEVREYMLVKAKDTDHWIGGMRKLREKIIAQVGSTKLEDMYKMFRGK